MMDQIEQLAAMGYTEYPPSPPSLFTSSDTDTSRSWPPPSPDLNQLGVTGDALNMVPRQVIIKRKRPSKKVPFVRNVLESKQRKLNIQRRRPVSIQRDMNHKQRVREFCRIASREPGPQDNTAKVTRSERNYTNNIEPEVHDAVYESCLKSGGESDLDDNLEPELHNPVYQSCLRSEDEYDADDDNVDTNDEEIARSSEDDNKSNAASEAKDTSIELVITTPADMRGMHDPVQTDKLPLSDLESEKRKHTGTAVIEHIVPAWLPKKIKKLFLIDRYGGQFTFKVDVLSSLPRCQLT